MTDSPSSSAPSPTTSDNAYGDKPEQVDLFSWKGLTYHRCFRPVMLTSLTSAVSVAFVTALRSRNAWRASSFFIYSSCAVAAVSWPLCRVQQKKKAANVRHIMEKNAPAKDVAAAKGLSDADRAEIERDVERAKQKK